MPGSVRVARILGIDIRIHISWLLIFGLVLLSLADQVFPAYYPAWSQQKTFVVSAIAASLFFASVLAHELAHALVARRFRMSVSSITLFLLGGVANLTKEPPSAKAEFFMAAAGPFTSFAIGGAGLGIQALTARSSDALVLLQPVEAIAGYLGFINIAVGLFNLVPGFPLDGGRVLRSIIWGIRGDRLGATRVAARGGQVVAGLLVLGGAYRAVLGDTAGGVWWGLIAYFLYSAASGTLQQERLSSRIGDSRVAQLMTTEFQVAPAGVTIGTLIRDVLLPHNLRAIAVTAASRLVGLVTIADLRKVDQEQWSATRVEEVMTPAPEVASVTPDDRLATAMERFDASGQPLLPVLRDGALVGVLYRESLAGYLRMREMLGADSRG